MNTIVSLQFGNAYQRRNPDFVLVSQAYKNPCYLWETPVTDCASLKVEDPLLEGYVQSQRPAEFWMGLPDGTYRLTITCYDPLKDHGPFTIEVNDIPILSDAAVKAGLVWTESFQAQPKAGILRLKFAPSSGNDFIVNTLVVEGTVDDIKPQPIFRSAPPVILPDKKELVAGAKSDPVQALRQICDWLIEHRRKDDFIGDTWQHGVDHWYTTSMPIRALLAGYDIVGNEKYLDAALTALDLFIDEQLPNGAFQGTFRGKPTHELGEAELKHCLQFSRLPMSDIGSVVSALAVGSHYAPPPRKERYVRAVQDFCDGWAKSFQLSSGAFTDGQWASYEGKIYSCATAIEAATFCLAYAVTGDTSYLEVATRAIRFLLKDWREDGRMLGRAPHWVVRSRQPFVMETLYFGDQWYYDEGFITTSRHVQDNDFRHKIDEALGWRIFGSQGLLHALKDEAWWPVQDIWNNAKSIGMVQTLLHARTCGMNSPAVEDVLSNMQRFLCTPEYSQRLGVMVDDAERPADVHGIRTWSGMRMEATGFAGMTLAEIIKPGVLYLSSNGQTKH